MAENTPNPPESSSNPMDDRPHKPADDREEVYFQGSPVLRAHLGSVFLVALAAAVLIAFPFVLRYYFQVQVPWWLMLSFIVIGLLTGIIPILVLKATRYRVSNYRIDFERGILSKSIDTLELWHVEDINFHQSLLDRILRVGTITIVSHDETTPKLALKGIPNPRPLFETLKQRVIAVKRQRGVIKMDIG